MVVLFCKHAGNNSILQTGAAAAAAKSLQSCPTLCDPRDSSPPGSPIPGILQARTLEWVAISFSNAWKWKVKVKSLSRFRSSATPWTAAFQAPPSMGFSRQKSTGVGCHCLLRLFSYSHLKPFQSQRKAMPKNAQTIAQLRSPHTLVNNAQNSPIQGLIMSDHEIPDV